MSGMPKTLTRAESLEAMAERERVRAVKIAKIKLALDICIFDEYEIQTMLHLAHIAYGRTTLGEASGLHDDR